MSSPPLAPEPASSPPRDPLTDLPVNIHHAPPTPDASPSAKRAKRKETKEKHKTSADKVDDSGEKIVASLKEKFDQRAQIKSPPSMSKFRLFNKMGYYQKVSPNSYVDQFFPRKYFRGESLLISSSESCFESLTSHPFCIKSLKTTSKVAIGTEEGDIVFYDGGYTHSEQERVHGLRKCIRKPHSTAVKDISISDNDSLLVSVGGDCQLQLFDISQKMHLGTAQTGSCNKVQFHPNNCNELITCDSVGTLTIHDIRTPSFEVVNITQNEIPSAHYDKTGKLLQKHRTGVTSAVWCDDKRFASCCETNSEIRLWDMRYLKKKTVAPFLQASPIPRSHKGSRSFGMVSLEFDLESNKLWGLCKDSHIYSYNIEDITTGVCDDFSSPELQIKDFYPTISLISSTPGINEGSYIAAGGTGKNAVLFPNPSRQVGNSYVKYPQADSTTVSSYAPTILTNGHIDNVGSLIQQKHTGRLASVSDDCSVRFWSFNESLTDDIKASSDTIHPAWAEEAS